MQETQVQSLGQDDPWRREWNPLQYSCLENFMDRRAWWARVQGIAKSDMTEWLTSPPFLKQYYEMYINVSFILLFKIVKIFDFSKILVGKFFPSLFPSTWCSYPLFLVFVCCFGVSFTNTAIYTYIYTHTLTYNIYFISPPFFHTKGSILYTLLCTILFFFQLIDVSWRAFLKTVLLWGMLGLQWVGATLSLPRAGLSLCWLPALWSVGSRHTGFSSWALRL